MLARHGVPEAPELYNPRYPQRLARGFEPLGPRRDTIAWNKLAGPELHWGFKVKFSSREVAHGFAMGFRHRADDATAWRQQPPVPKAAQRKLCSPNLAGAPRRWSECRDGARKAAMSRPSRRTAVRRSREVFRQIAMRLPLDEKSCGALPSDRVDRRGRAPARRHRSCRSQPGNSTSLPSRKRMNCALR